MRAVTYACECFAAEPVRHERLEVLERGELGRGVPFAEEGEVGFLVQSESKDDREKEGA